MYSCDLLKEECSPVKVACHPLNYLFHFRIRDNWRSARPCFACSSAGRSFIKPLYCSSPLNFSLTRCFTVREPLLNKAPESYAPWCFILFTSCLSLDVAYNKDVEAVEAIHSCRVKDGWMDGREKLVESSAARDSPPYQGVCFICCYPLLYLWSVSPHRDRY
jgi:hypothetical protein